VDKNDYVDVVREVIARTFECSPGDVTAESGPGDLPQWDSLGHILLLEALRERIGADIPVERAIEARTVGALAMLLAEAG
jgi:acyl carrier protein